MTEPQQPFTGPESAASGRNDISALITRLEGLSGPDGALDAEIVAVLNNAIVKRYPPTDDFGPKNRWQFWTRDGAHFLGSENKYPVPNLTASIDAALTLLPEGWRWGRNQDGSCFVFRHYTDVITTEHERVAIALAIAALKAIQATHEFRKA